MLVGLALQTCPVTGAWAQPAASPPVGQMTWAVHFTLAPRWLDPAESEGTITPFLTLYAVHDALLKPMPSGPSAPSLAESWSASPSGLVYDFTLRSNARFHNGEPVTAEDVKFSFERYRGANAAVLKEHVQEIRVLDARRIQFHLKDPWADFITFYGTTATSAGWIVPKKYIEQVGEDGFKKAPIGAGPYRVVAFAPGVEITLEAFARPRVPPRSSGAMRTWHISSTAPSPRRSGARPACASWRCAATPSSSWTSGASGRRARPGGTSGCGRRRASPSIGAR